VRTTTFSASPKKISRLCLGTMMFGDKCDYPTSESIVRTALDLGINFIDTASMYSNGTCEEFLGKSLKGRREEVFIVTKVVKGIDRKSIIESIDESLKRLQMEYVDAYLIHWPVPGMDIKEMMAGLNEVVKAGKTKYVGCCNFPAWLLASANAVAAENGWPKMVCNQVAYNLIERGIEVEILPQAMAEGIAIMAYRPLAVGLLTGKFRQGKPFAENARGTTDSRVITWFTQHSNSIERFVNFAEAKGVPPAELAVAWVAYSPAVTAPIIGVSSVDQLKDSAKADNIKLSPEEYKTITDMFDTEVKEEGLQLFPGLKYNFPRLRRNLFLLKKQ
jgi:aryl-alcohol dehydrogenase-like predicted oxidoreductase